jgi:hypothetical protein
MEDYDKEYYAKMQVLREECAALGHNFKFLHFGPLGNPWYYCTYCNQSKVDPIDA